MNTATIDRWDRDYLCVSYKFDQSINDVIKSIPGREWIHSMKHWRIPVGSSNLLLTSLVAHQIPINLTDMATVYLQTYKDIKTSLLEKKSGPKTGWIMDEVKIDGMEYYLRPYQAVGVDHSTLGKRTLNADDMGLGKTVEAIASILLWQPRTTLVVCLNSLKYNWLRELKKHAPHLKVLIVEGSKATRQAMWEAEGYEIKICNYHLLRIDEDIMPLNWDCIVADEATAFKNYSSLTARKIKRLHSHYAIAATGTPMENNIMELWSIFDWVRPGLLGPNWDFQQRHVVRGFGGVIQGYKDVGDIHERIAPFMIRRKKKDVLKDLPPKLFDPKYIQITTQERKLYRKWNQAIVEEIDALGTITPIATQNVLTKMLRLKQIVDHPLILEAFYDGKVSKLDALKDIVSETDDKVVVFTQFETMANILAREFDTETIKGAVSPEERLRIIDRFTDNDKQVLVSTDAGAYGLTITAASIVVHYDLTWNPAKQAQREDRLHRYGQTEPVTVIELIAEDTLDEYIKDVLFRKLQAFEDIIESVDDSVVAQRITTFDVQQMLRIGV